MKKIPPGRVRSAQQHVWNASRKAARSIGKGLRHAIKAAALAARLHNDKGVPRGQAVSAAARAVLKTVGKRG